MATTQIVQYLGTSQTTGLGVSAPVGGSTSDRSQVETFLAGAAITAGDFVVFDTSKTGANRVLYVIQSPATAGQSIVVGVALNSATAADQKVDVVVSGYVASANVVTGVLKGESITTSGATAGRCLKYATGTHTNAGPIGVALEDAAANVAACWIFKHF